MLYAVSKLISKLKGIKLPKLKDTQKEIRRDNKRLKNYLRPDDEVTYLGLNSKREVFIPNDCKHIFVCGTTGSGKTVALSNFINSISEYDYPALIVDGKGDISKDSLLDIIIKLKGNKKVYIVDLNNPNKSMKYNPFKNTTATVVKDMLINLTFWSEEHYKVNADRYIQKMVTLMSLSKISFSFESLIKHIQISKFKEISVKLEKDKVITKEEHLNNLNIAETSGKVIEDSISRFTSLIESDIGTIFSEDGLDIYTALKENYIILFILNPLLYPEISPLFGNLITIDSKKAVSKLYQNSIERAFFIFDEINVYASRNFLDLVNKSRSANVTCVLAAQSLSDLEAAADEHFKEQVIENCINYIIMRQNSAKNSEEWANIIGTRNAIDMTFQVEDKGATGLGSVRQTRKYHYHPDHIKALAMGKAIFLSKDNSIHCEVSINKPF